MISFNQKGFILPLTLIICLIFPVFILAQVEMYKSEQRFYVELEQIEQLNSLTQIGFKDIITLVEAEPNVKEEASTSLSGCLTYPIGTIHYQVDVLKDLVVIKGNCQTLKQRNHFFQATIDKETKEIVKWVEG